MKLLTAFGLAVLLAGVLAASACGGSSTGPSFASPAVTETFTGTLANLGSNSHTFVLSKAGEIDITMTAQTLVVNGVTTNVTVPLSMDLGVWTNNACSGAYTFPNVVQTGYAIAQLATTATTYCIRIYDQAGNVPSGSPLTYTVTVAHP